MLLFVGFLWTQQLVFFYLICFLMLTGSFVLLYNFYYFYFIPSQDINTYLMKDHHLNSKNLTMQKIRQYIVDLYVETNIKASLLEELHEKNERLHRNNQITETMMNITTYILDTQDLSSVLNKVLAEAISLTPNANKGSILFREGNEMVFVAAQGYDFETLKKIKFKIEELYSYQLNSLYSPCIINDILKFYQDNLPEEKLNEMLNSNALDIKSVVSAPIIINGDLCGVLNLDNEEKINAFTDEDKTLLKHLSTQIAIAIKNAHNLEKIVNLSRFDSLTGIYNRNYFEDLVKAGSCLLKDKLTVVVFDINDLKKVNDTYGHRAGDLLIQTFSHSLKSSVRNDDITARVGGDEFVALLRWIDGEKVERIIERITEKLEIELLEFIPNESYYVTFSYGIATYPNESDNINNVLRLADDRMYAYKRIYKAKCSS
jgi:diguanylate cyclase (GGDEF)-like protein